MVCVCGITVYRIIMGTMDQDGAADLEFVLLVSTLRREADIHAQGWGRLSLIFMFCNGPLRDVGDGGGSDGRVLCGQEQAAVVADLTQGPDLIVTSKQDTFFSSEEGRA
ncbi:hypothetical protein E2C01_005051 [Portunus trituberculatus]|uniref:Uncharacterized protein n=1 Tax=Portunus trituberculatus TaxID=210409 RepID=A0A5B7CY29_PORTR|nr:hypothetical protein [Portunus trituberculatus]